MLRRLTGIPASPGLSMGHAVLIRAGADTEKAGRSIDSAEIDAQVARAQEAIKVASAELLELGQQAEAKVGKNEAAIFSAQSLMLSDPDLQEAIERLIEENLVPAERAALDASEAQAHLLEGLDDPYMAARATDLRDIGRRLVRVLLGLHGRGIPRDLPDNSVIVADDLAPSETVLLDAGKVVGIVLDKGGATSHTAILARSLGIPAVVGTGSATSTIADGETLVVVGDKGEVLIDPGDAERTVFNDGITAFRKRKHDLLLLKDLPSVTRDGRRIEIAANTGGVKDAAEARKVGAEGSGLFRTEFLFIDRPSMPSEEEQYAVYKQMLLELAPRPVVIRTLDAGGDKDIGYLDLPKEENPFLGLRAIRLCLKERSIFRTQLRALLRASVYGNLRIMFPMVANVVELREAKKEYEAARRELIAEGIPMAEHIEVGIMVEIPSAAVDADILAKECDFFSIGTNDLVQYTMACDRGNAAIGYLSDPFYPAVLRLIRRTIEEGHKCGIWVGMCGEMAGMPLAVPLLVGMGIDELSVAVGSVLKVKEIVRNLHFQDASAIRDRIEGMGTKEEVKEYLASLLHG